MFLLGANSCWRPDTCAPLCTINRHRETARAGSGLQPEPCSLNKRQPVEQSQRPEIHKPPGSSCMLEPAKATVGRPFRVAIPGACSDSCKAKALPYVLSIKQIKVAEGIILPSLKIEQTLCLAISGRFWQK